MNSIASAIRYDVDAKTFEGRLLVPSSGKLRGGLLFAPDWYGVYDYPISEAGRFARLGFAVLVADVYGANIRPTNDDDAARMSSELRADRAAVRARMTAALQTLRSRLAVGTKISAFGFSLGGMAVLELARSGADLTGVVLLSGVLDSPTPADAANVRAPVLVLHGSHDVISPMNVVTALAASMDAAHRPYRLIVFGGAAHAFTNPLFANATDGPLRYSPVDAALADDAAFDFLATLHPSS
ncbi:MAG TPA: dienelactone hydrolase family protein [Polyangiaceae bacterium]|nr:dienelactone hydrolase family protein [Polyangiaceae bacterium]